MSIFFISEETNFSIQYKNKLKQWIKNAIKQNGLQPSQINIIFTTDEFLNKLNRKYLFKKYYTDIITFNYSKGEKISGDIFISIETVKQNAKKYQNQFKNELYRVIIHGVLHLIGFDDKDENDLIVMKNKEDYYLDLLIKK